MLKQLLCWLFLLLGFLGRAQTLPSDSVQFRAGLKMAYLGSVAYPGIKAGLEIPYKVIRVEKVKPNRTKTYFKERYFTANLGFYHHANFHDNLFLQLEQQRRRQKTNGWFSEFSPGIGFSRTFIEGTTYRVSDDGEVDKTALFGYSYGLLSLSLSKGYNFQIKRGTPIKIYGKASLMGLFPSNSTLYFRPTVELGLIYLPMHFLKSNPTFKIKKK